ncbi:S1 family peptidase [Usitatibacter palustris]|uniref:J domain-containing protein n=1 Tax=Usitatibacter palustris TaxID=2732487 RepID=A0A6M4H2M9_9PROT|nr:serine protease [Usitatibacter palustris]QJR13811.1 hypothetical protein DSM104440_00601 [Usitatibacter palustris]
MPRSYYQVLGITRDASLVDIESAYREKMAEMREKPEADPTSRESIREAYFVLSSVDRRADYDDTLPPDPRARRAPVRETSHDDGDGDIKERFAALMSRPLFKWGAAFLVLAFLFVAWSASRSKPPPKVVETQPVKTNNELILSAAPEAAPTPLPPSTAPRGGTAEDVFGAVSASIARVKVSDASGKPVGQGSGVVISHGVVITNCHVTNGGSNFTVKVGQYEYNAAVSQADEEYDLCKLSVAGLDASPVELGTVTTVRTGQRVFAIGAPHGLELTISEGIVSSLRESGNGPVIQTTAPISPGSSGGGLFNASAQLVGIVTFQHKYGQNLNFAIPADWINQMQSRSR